MSEVAPGIDRLETMLGKRRSCVYLVHGSRGSLLFDVGVEGDSSAAFGPYLKGRRGTASPLQWAVISHCDVDHFGGVADAKETFPGARVVAHELDAAAISDFDVYLRVRGRGFLADYGLDEDPEVVRWERQVTREAPVDLRVLGGEQLDLGDRLVELLHTPGHTRGHLVLRDLESGALLVGDAVLGSAVVNADGTGAFPPTYRYVNEYLATIERLRQLQSPLLLTAHEPVYSGSEVSAFLDTSQEFAEDLGTRVERVLSDELPGGTLASISEAVNDGFGNWPREGTAGAIAFPVAGHIEDLIARGRAWLEPGGPAGCSRIWPNRR